MSDTPEERIRVLAEALRYKDGGLHELVLRTRLWLPANELILAIHGATQEWPERPLLEEISDAVGFATGRDMIGAQIEDTARWSHSGLEDILDPVPKSVQPVSLGVHSVDQLVGPDTSQFIVVGAHAKQGKSSFCFQAADATSELMGMQQGGVLIVSLEMLAREIGAIRLAQKLGVSARPDLRHPERPSLRTLSDSEKRRARAYLEAWQDAKDMRIIDMEETQGKADLEYLMNLVRRHKERYPACRLVIWDHTALADIRGAKADHERVMETTRVLKRLQSELDVCILAPTQANEDPKQKQAEGDTPPNITQGMLLGGASIKRNPSHVILLRDVSGDALAARPRVDAVLTHCRNGPNGKCELVFDKAGGQRFLDAAPVEPKQAPKVIGGRYKAAPSDDEDLFN